MNSECQIPGARPAGACDSILSDTGCICRVELGNIPPSGQLAKGYKADGGRRYIFKENLLDC